LTCSLVDMKLYLIVENISRPWIKPRVLCILGSVNH
jgi:hypothetical protein